MNGPELDTDSMKRPTVLVVAKAPVPGLAKTRVATTVGHELAAELAAAALLDTLEAVSATGWPIVIAMTGDLGAAARGDEICAAIAPFTVIEQRGKGLGERLATAHADADAGSGIVQIGMDTPQLSAADLWAAGEALNNHDAVVGPAIDGGWWLLALRSAVHANILSTVPMSRPDTCRLTLRALTEAGADVGTIRPLSDVDHWADALVLAADYPNLRMSAVVRRVADLQAVSR